MKRKHSSSMAAPSAALAVALVLLCHASSARAAAPGPEPIVPDGGSPPGAYPNTSVTAVNVIARGGTTFDATVEIPGFNGQGPIPWAINRYNRGDFALRLAPADPEAALEPLDQGFIEFADASPAIAANHVWKPTPRRGVIIPTVTQNGPIDWNDGEGPFYPTIGTSEVSSAPGYDMVTGEFAAGNLDINTGKAGTHASSPEANFNFSATWFPYDQGWLGGEAAGPYFGDPFLPDGTSRWTLPDAHAAGLSAGIVRWPEFPTGFGTFGGVAEVRLPGVNSLEDGMLFATSAEGSSDIKIVGVAPMEGGNGWLITIREDSATDAETVVTDSQSDFQFVYIPFDAVGLVGGHITGADGAKRKAVGDFTVTRTATGTYELTFPGKTGDSGTLLLQAAAFEPGTTEPMATKAFLSYEFVDGRFIVQSRATTSDTEAPLRDVDFYVVWIDFEQPLSPPDGPRMRSQGPVVVSPENVRVGEAGVAAHTTEPELLVTTIDLDNAGGYADPITGDVAFSAVIGRFHNARTLEPTSDPFPILGNPTGIFERHDVKFNPVSTQYVVVATTRTYGPFAHAVPLVALVNPASVAGGESPVAKSFAWEEDTEIDFEDVAVAVNTQNGDFMIVAEYKVPDEGEATVGALFDSEGNILTPEITRLDVLQSIGDEDDPDVIYLANQNAYLYFANTDNSNGSDGPYSNRIAGSVVDAVPNQQGGLVTRPEQALGDGEPAGTAEGHPAAIQNPFNGELIVAYDAGNNTANGTLAYVNIGAPPEYQLTQARPEVPYLNGPSVGDPFNHQHPQIAVDPQRGVFMVGFNATGSTVGFADGYAFTLLGPDGAPLPSQLKAPYLLANAPGGLGNTANYHVVKYSPAAGAFVVAYTTSNPTTTYLASLEVTSNHLGGGGDEPSLSARLVGASVEISWPVAEGFQLQSSPSIGPGATWNNVTTAPTMANGTNTVSVTPDGPAQFYRLTRP